MYSRKAVLMIPENYNEMTEDEKIRQWKFECFEKMGFTTNAITLLLDWRVDPHDAQNLLARGFPLELALDYLRPDLVPA